MGCSIASDVWLSDRISSWISKVLFVTRMSSEEDSRWFPATLSWRRSRKSSKGTQRRPRMCELLVRGLFVGLVRPETLRAGLIVQRRCFRLVSQKINQRLLEDRHFELAGIDRTSRRERFL